MVLTQTVSQSFACTYIPQDNESHLGALEALTGKDLRSHAARSRNRLFDALLHFDLNRASDTKQSMPHIFQSLVFYFIIP